MHNSLCICECVYECMCVCTRVHERVHAHVCVCVCMCSVLLQSESLREHLFIMERIINLNTYQPKQALYRGFPILPGRHLLQTCLIVRCMHPQEWFCNCLVLAVFPYGAQWII